MNKELRIDFAVCDIVFIGTKFMFQNDNHYALLACRLVLQCAKFYKMEKIYLTCDYDNIASYKIIENLCGFGATLVEETVPPKDYIFYYDGIAKHKIYELLIQ